MNGQAKYPYCNSQIIQMINLVGNMPVSQKINLSVYINTESQSDSYEKKLNRYQHFIL